MRTKILLAGWIVGWSVICLATAIAWPIGFLLAWAIRVQGWICGLLYYAVRSPWLELVRCWREWCQPASVTEEQRRRAKLDEYLNRERRARRGGRR